MAICSQEQAISFHFLVALPYAVSFHFPEVGDCPSSLVFFPQCTIKEREGWWLTDPSQLSISILLNFAFVFGMGPLIINCFCVHGQKKIPKPYTKRIPQIQWDSRGSHQEEGHLNQNKNSGFSALGSPSLSRVL